MGTLKLPNMNEFSPSVVGELGPLLQLVASAQGQRSPLVRAIAEHAPTIVPRPNSQHLNRANNVLIGMSQCGLFDLATNQLTPFGAALAGLPDEAQRHTTFAKHLLEACHGNAILDVVRSLKEKGLPRTGDNIRSELRARGFAVTTNEGNAFKIRLWLQRAGVIDERWTIDENRYATIMGITIDIRDQWRALTRSQRAFLLTLRQIHASSTPRWVSGSHVKELCQAQWGPTTLPEGSLRAKVIDILERFGWIQTRGKGEGRGGKLGDVIPTAKLLDIDATLELEQSLVALPEDIAKKMDLPLDELHDRLASSDDATVQSSLEALALRFCHDLALRPVRFLPHRSKPLHPVVTLAADEIGIHYTRWLIHCQRPPASLPTQDDLAECNELAVAAKAHVVLWVTTGQLPVDAPKYANSIAANTTLQFILLDTTELQKSRTGGPGRLIDTLRAQARTAQILKDDQIPSL